MQRIFIESDEAVRATLRSDPQGIVGRGGSTRREAKASLLFSSPASALLAKLIHMPMKESSARRGRPPVTVRKIGFPIMLDPRYLEDLKKEANDKDIHIQDLMRKALYAKLPNRYRD